MDGNCQFKLTKGIRKGENCNSICCNSNIYFCLNHKNIVLKNIDKYSDKYQTEILNIINSEKYEESKNDIDISLVEDTKDNCKLCNMKVYKNNSFVNLKCKCIFHLKCYKLIFNEINCINCGKNIEDNKNEDFYDEYDTCSICLDEISNNNFCHKTICNHMFHKKCYNELEKLNIKNCPICRTLL